MAPQKFSVKIRGDQENPDVTFKPPPPFSSAPKPSRFPFGNLGEPKKKKMDYQDVCSSFLGEAKYEISFKNWALWSLWSADLVHDDTDFESNEIFTEFVNEIVRENPFFEKNEWLDLLPADYIVRVTKASGDNNPCGKGCLLKGYLVDFESPSKRKVVKLKGFHGLAEILSTVCQPNDLLVICGVGLNKVGEQKVPTIWLDGDDENHLQIFRLPGYEFDEEINLVELIEPAVGEHRYRFKYSATGIQIRRDITQHRDFDCTKSRTTEKDSMAYKANRWDFPVPVVKDTALSIYNSLVRWDFSMFSESKAMRPPPPAARRVKPVNAQRFSTPAIPPRPKRKTAMVIASECTSFMCTLFLWLFLVGLVIFVVCNVEQLLGGKDDCRNSNNYL